MKILLKRNLLENVTLLSSGGIIICVLLHYLTNLSLLPGKWFFLYIFTLFIISVFSSFKCIQWLLKLNKPLCWADVEEFPLSKQLVYGMRAFAPGLFAERVKYVWKEYDTNELSVISTVLERKLVSSWYVPYISEEIGFPFACKQMLDQMIARAFQICSNIETKDVFVDICTILSLHLKEYDKAVKRHEKSPSTPIETLYKKSHPISDPDNKYSSVEHCTNILRIMIKELLPWELRDTPHSELLVRILSMKLDSYIDSTLVDPDWLNDKLMTYLTGEEYVEEEKEPEIEKPVEKVEVGKTAAQNEFPEVKNEETQSVTESLEEDSVTELKDLNSPVLRQKRGRQGRNEVKIYDRIIEGSVKTWETDMDLQCISLGQDLLASLDGEITLSRLWGQEEGDGSPDTGGKSPQLWFGEEDNLELEVPPTSGRLTPHSPKPDALLKDLQSTVREAKTKITDLQVRDSASDEAAGMMEGLLDFGIAGLKKGLRFTGLSDDSQERSPLHCRDKSADKSPPEWNKAHSEVPEQALPALVIKEENGNGVPLLVKQSRVTSQDSVPSSQPIAVPSVPAESPEPQYEEAADLSTSIAKLRRLLRQRAEAQPRSEGAAPVWWEGAEETRGRTHHHHSSRPVEAATLADEYDMNLERSSPNQTSNNMQRLDKLFQRTVTGVFNSIKTATRGADEPASQHEWAYVHTTNELSVCVVAARLAWSRRARGAGVEAALDSLQMQDAPQSPPHAGAGAAPDDLEEWLSGNGRAWSASCASARVLLSHVAHTLLTVCVAELCEWLLSGWLAGLGARLREQIFAVFSRLEDGAGSGASSGGGARRVTRRARDVDATCAAILHKMPVLVLLFGEERMRSSVRRSVSSLEHAQVNRDVVHRALDVLALHYTRAAKARARDPTFHDT